MPDEKITPEFSPYDMRDRHAEILGMQIKNMQRSILTSYVSTLLQSGMLTNKQADRILTKIEKKFSTNKL